MDTLIFNSNKTISRAVMKRVKQVCGGVGYCICRQKLKLRGGRMGMAGQIRLDEYHILEPT